MLVISRSAVADLRVGTGPAGEGDNIYLIGNASAGESDLPHDSDFIICNAPGDAGPGFSTDLAKGFVPGGTAAYAALQACHYAGFEKVFMVGADHPPSTEDYGLGGESGFSSVYRDHLAKCFRRDFLPAFRTVKRVTENGQFQVYSLSPKSPLPDTLVPRTTLEQALKGADL